MDTEGIPKNFDGLLAAWLAKLDTETLNKQFYQQLFNWFEWAITEAKFPTNEAKTLNPQEHLIRLITRLLFIWFLKEKGLVADALFNETQIRPLLKDDDFENGDAYYRAVLQNLFFATLNTEMDKRGFSTGQRKTHRDFSRYRYKAERHDPDKLLDLFSETPFINGGLFDCLDSFRGADVATAEDLLKLRREHSTIENKVHWVRDTVLGEDASQARTGNLPHVMAALRNTAMSVLRFNGHTKIAETTRFFASEPKLAVNLIL